MKITGQTTLDEFQEYVRSYIEDRGFTKDPTVKFFKLVEEVGELSKAMGSKIGLKSDSTTKLESIESEMADVLLLLFGLASTLGINLAEAVEDKEAKNRKRTWK